MRIIFNALRFCFAVLSGANAASAPVNDLPFEYAEELLWAQDEVPQSARPLNFLFDTGAEESVIHADTVSALGLSAGSKIQVQGVDATTIGESQGSKFFIWGVDQRKY